jgi:ferric-dicitrate binding protein FerR (iron transport regulator)
MYEELENGTTSIQHRGGVIEFMTERNHKNLKTEVEFAEWMIGLLLSDDRPSEDMLDEIRIYLADDKDSELKREVLDKLFLRVFRSRRSDERVTGTYMAEEMWPLIANEFGLNPDLSHYRTDIRAVAKPLRRSTWRRIGMRVAAVLIPMLVVTGAVWLWNQRAGNPTEPSVIANVEVSVPRAGQKRIVLPDGSQVWVNSHSTIAYNDDFSKERTVTLDGEAFFSVVRDTLSPFRVKTAKMVIEVLGTEFNVNAHTGEATSEVALVKGSVNVKTPRNEAIKLTPNQRLTHDAESSKAVVDEIDAKSVSMWRITDLRMVDMPLSEALDRIASYYGRNLSMVGTLPDGDLVDFSPVGELPVEQVLDVVHNITGNFNYRLTQDDIIITPVTLKKE